MCLEKCNLSKKLIVKNLYGSSKKIDLCKER